GGGPAHAAPLVHFEIRAALVIAAIEVVDGGDVGLAGGLTESVQYLPGQALRLYAPTAGRPMKLAGACMMLFDILEDGQHVIPAPAGIALGRPTVVVGRLPAHVDHAVDRRATAQHPAARIAENTIVDAGIGLGAVAPIGASIADAIQIAHRYVYPAPIVASAGLQ